MRSGNRCARVGKTLKNEKRHKKNGHKNSQRNEKEDMKKLMYKCKYLMQRNLSKKDKMLQKTE